MKIGIIGSGNMGRVIGGVLAERGHEVLFGGRDAGAARAAAALVGARHGTNDEAASFGDVLLWTVRDVPPNQVLLRPEAVVGKVVLDPNNGPIPADYRLGPAGLSHGERLAKALPGARVVVTLNTAAQEIYDLPREMLATVSGFYAGDDPDAKRTAALLLRDIGLDPVDTGPLEAARMLEGVADFIRRMMSNLGVYATVSVRVLPEAEKKRFGGRTPTRLA